MATEQQLIEAFKAAADSGDDAAAKVFATELQKLRTPALPDALANLRANPKVVPQLGQQAEADKLTGGDRFRRGFDDVIGDRTTQLYLNAAEKLGFEREGLADTFTNMANKEQADYEAQRQQQAQAEGKPEAGLDGVRIAGNVYALAPLALLPGGQNFASRAAFGALQGGAGGALSYDPTNSVEGTAKNTAVGAGVGAVLGPAAGFVADKGGKALGALFGKAKGAIATLRGGASEAQIRAAVPELAQLSPDDAGRLIWEAAQQVKSTGVLNAEEIARKANLIANKVKPLGSMVTRNPQQWAQERNLSKLTGPDERFTNIASELTDVYRANDKALAERLGSFRQGLPQGSKEELGQAGMKALKDVSTETQRDVGAIYTGVRNALGDGEVVTANKIVAALGDRGLRFNPRSKPLVEAVREYARDMGLIDAQGKAARAISVKDAESLRQFVNTLDDTFGRKDLIKAIDDDVIAAAGSDAFAPARAAASQRFDLLDNPATQRALNTMGELQQGKAAQGFIRDQIVRGAEQDVETLLKTMATKPDAVGALQSGVLQHFEDLAINPNSGQFSGAAFNKAVQEFGPRKLNLLFGADGAAKIQSLARAAVDATYQPAYSGVNSSGTAPALLSLTRQARRIPGVPLLVTDEAEKAIAQTGYQRQLANALAARPTNQVPSEAARQIAALLSRTVTPSGVGAVDSRRQQVQNKAERR